MTDAVVQQVETLTISETTTIAADSLPTTASVLFVDDSKVEEFPGISEGDEHSDSEKRNLPGRLRGASKNVYGVANYSRPISRSWMTRILFPLLSLSRIYLLP